MITLIGVANTDRWSISFFFSSLIYFLNFAHSLLLGDRCGNYVGGYLLSFSRLGRLMYHDLQSILILYSTLFVIRMILDRSIVHVHMHPIFTCPTPFFSSTNSRVYRWGPGPYA